MSNKQAVYSSRTADKFVIRLPDDMREKIAQLAKDHHRSMNSQIINWLEICIALEDAGIPVTKDTLAVAGETLKEESAKPVVHLSIGETVRVPEKYCNDLTGHTEVFGDKPRTLETDEVLVEVYALGRITEIVTNGWGVGVKVCWLHTGCESKWITFQEIQKLA